MKGRVLIVDDDPLILRPLRRALERAGYETHTAASAGEALERLEDVDVDAVVSDQRMPDLPGTELLARVRRRHPDVIRLLLTGDRSLHSAQDAINRGRVHRYLQKPSQSEDVVRAIGEAMAENPEAAEQRRRRRSVRRYPQVERPPGEVVVLDPMRIATLLDALRRTLCGYPQPIAPTRYPEQTDGE